MVVGTGQLSTFEVEKVENRGWWSRGWEWGWEMESVGGGYLRGGCTCGRGEGGAEGKECVDEDGNGKERDRG